MVAGHHTRSTRHTSSLLYNDVSLLYIVTCQRGGVSREMHHGLQWKPMNSWCVSLVTEHMRGSWYALCTGCGGLSVTQLWWSFHVNHILDLVPCNGLEGIILNIANHSMSWDLHIQYLFPCLGLPVSHWFEYVGRIGCAFGHFLVFVPICYKARFWVYKPLWQRFNPIDWSPSRGSKCTSTCIC